MAKTAPASAGEVGRPQCPDAYAVAISAWWAEKVATAGGKSASH